MHADLGLVFRIVTFLITLSVLIVLHEWGHFIVAKLSKVRVTDFAIGFGPSLLTVRYNGTNYRLNPFLVGGYCLMLGEDGRKAEQAGLAPEPVDLAEEGGKYGTDFQSKPVWARLAIVVAGPFMNFVLGFAIFVVALAGIGQQVPTTTVASLSSPAMPAAKAGLRPGDTITAIDGVPIADGTAMVKRINRSAGIPLTLTVRRDDRTLSIHVTPVESEVNGRHLGLTGFVPGFRSVPVPLAQALPQARDQTLLVLASTVGSLVQLVTHFTHAAPQLSGIIGIGQVATQVEQQGAGPYLVFAGSISILLGFFNLLPLPALDGGRAAFFIAEILRGKPIDPEKEGLVHVVGFAVLMALMLVIALHDIQRLLMHQSLL
ncbi:MAG: site-2 protease family protein [bacterium]|nr:site-2 protease family protein [bacterium]